MTSLNCVDTSKWGGPLTADEAMSMKAQGIETVIVATGPGGYGLHAAQQTDAAHAAGMRVEAYTFLEFESDPAMWIDSAVGRLFGKPIARWWLDVEDNAHGMNWTPFQRAVYVQEALDQFQKHGIFAHIYSARWYWPSYMGNTDQFAKQGRKLWNSWYDGDADIDGLPYGGWTQADVAIEQYQGTTEIAGQSVDLNHLYFTGEEDDMTPDEVRAIVREELDARGFEVNVIDYLDARLDLAREGERILNMAWDREVELAVLRDMITGLRELP